MRRPNPILAFLAMLALGVSSQPSSFEPAAAADVRMKWPVRTIQIALSSSLTWPSANIKPGSDVAGAAQRALNAWSTVANIKFVVVPSRVQSISPASGGDGINLITIAPTAENLNIFGDGNNAARTRVFYDSETGEITEADIAINPFPYSNAGDLLQFSTDGTPGTYDLESTFAHEIGHLLGLNHSSVVAATMQAAQALNGTYGMPALTERTLSEADRVAVRSLYGPCEDSGSVKGKILNSTQGSLLPSAGAHVWLEDLASGRVIAGTRTSSNGKFSLGCVAAGEYRAIVEYLDGSMDDEMFVTASTSARDDKAFGRQKAFRSAEISSYLRVADNKTASVTYVLVPPYNSPRSLQPRFLGLGSDLSIVPVPARRGTKVTIYVSGLGVDQVPGSGIVVNSPFITVDPASLALEQFQRATPVVSFDVMVAGNAPPGDYSIRLQSNSGETAYLVGAITIEPDSDH